MEPWPVVSGFVEVERRADEMDDCVIGRRGA
jgi:hypothetical protein